ncbi:hypothetical protein M409DRAFT_54272 [Zasmidium cellare ATCC 36951]|uniref:Carbonic anhydrase n=1 Tax=Zasmidium cellare ATCC 36951 TaxID=1080233 RepID=A0A6A6CLN0_ZASCE|nr:uncharacterized protein M409DRAFT_54272 [Zasmidium cellare ATCC 36951]KAF2167060.1 hypothetical protein M409DRAFT_54272 [Zasmidium cellare ATCC 36951]
MASVEQRFQALVELACCDSRVDPTAIFKIQLGEATVLKNAGGRVTDDTFRSLGVVGSISTLGLIVVLHHTDCGGLFRTDEDIRKIWSDRNPEHAQEISTKAFGTYKDSGLEECLRQDVAKVRGWPLLPKDVPVVGYSYEVETGRVTQVV